MVYSHLSFAIVATALVDCVVAVEVFLFENVPAVPASGTAAGKNDVEDVAFLFRSCEPDVFAGWAYCACGVGSQIIPLNIAWVSRCLVGVYFSVTHLC